LPGIQQPICRPVHDLSYKQRAWRWHETCKRQAGNRDTNPAANSRFRIPDIRCFWMPRGNMHDKIMRTDFVPLISPCCPFANYAFANLTDESSANHET
jgi:hypothetical protein